MFVYPPWRDVDGPVPSPPEIREPWHSIDAQEYPFRLDVVEFAYANTTSSWFGRWIDIKPNSNVSGLMWRAVPVNWPTVPRPAS